MKIKMASTPCTHYRRKCQVKFSCCGGVFGCVQCHNEVQSHRAKRKDLEAVICSDCKHQQDNMTNICSQCDTKFGEYFCGSCWLFDEEKGQYHCDGCGLCRIGGRIDYYHCDTCEMCLPVSLKSTHKCIEKMSHANCPVCQEYLHTSPNPCHIPPCHHLVHKHCFEGLLSNGHYYCPTCSKSLLDLSPLWQIMQSQIEKSPMQGRYKDLLVNVMCRDCSLPCQSQFHWIGLICSKCKGFNTVRTDEKFYKGDELVDLEEEF